MRSLGIPLIVVSVLAGCRVGPPVDAARPEYLIHNITRTAENDDEGSLPKVDDEAVEAELDKIARDELLMLPDRPMGGFVTFE